MTNPSPAGNTPEPPAMMPVRQTASNPSNRCANRIAPTVSAAPLRACACCRNNDMLPSAAAACIAATRSGRSKRNKSSSLRASIVLPSARRTRSSGAKTGASKVFITVFLDFPACFEPAESHPVLSATFGPDQTQPPEIFLPCHLAGRCGDRNKKAEVAVPKDWKKIRSVFQGLEQVNARCSQCLKTEVATPDQTHDQPAICTRANSLHTPASPYGEPINRARSVCSAPVMPVTTGQGAVKRSGLRASRSRSPKV